MENRRNLLWLTMSALLLTGLFTGRSIFFTLTYILFGLILASRLWSWAAVWGIRLSRRTHQKRSQVGKNFAETFKVTNANWIPKLWLEVRDYSDIPGHRASAVVPFLRSQGRFEWRVQTVCMARGAFQLGPMLISSGDPFGLFITTRKVSAVDHVLIHPPMVTLYKFNLPVGMLSGGDTQRYLTQQITPNAAGVREYVHGDSINRIHWKSTARRNKPIVKEFELDPMVDIWLMVDFSAESLVEAPNLKRVGTDGVALIPSVRDLPPSTEEYSVVTAASLAAYFIRERRSLGFLAYVPHREVFQPERSPRQLQRILEALALARSRSQQTLVEMLSNEAMSLTRGTTLIVITSSHDVRFVQRLQVLRMRGIRPICVYIDPTTFQYRIDSLACREALMASGIPTTLVRYGDDLSQVLTQRTF